MHNSILHSWLKFLSPRRISLYFLPLFQYWCKLPELIVGGFKL